MGIPSPEAHDALLLIKVKQMISAVLNNPKRRTSQVSYERFVSDLDPTYRSNLVAVESIIHETVVRMRHPPSASTSTAPTRGAEASANTGASRVGSRTPRLSVRRTRVLTSDSSSSDEDAVYARPLPRPAETTDGAGSAPSRRETLPTISRLLQLQAQATGRPLTGQTEATSEEGAGPSRTTEQSRNLRRAIDYLRADSDAARSRVMEDLFGYEDDRPRIAETGSSASTNSSSRMIHLRTIPVLPTYQELWSILLDDTPYPTERISSLQDLVREINASPFSTTQLLADDLRALVTELQERDPTVAIRIGNVVRRRNPRNPRTHEREGQQEEGVEGVRAFTSLFHEHIPTGDVSTGVDAEGPFASFASRRRANRRAEREVAEEVASPDGEERATMSEEPLDQDEVVSLLMEDADQGLTALEARHVSLHGDGPLPPRTLDAASSAAPSSSADTPRPPQVDTPASSLAQSPACAPSPPASAPPARPLTSAAIAEAAQIARRRIAPLPSSAPNASAPAGSQYGLVAEDGQPRAARLNLAAMLRAGWE